MYICIFYSYHIVYNMNSLNKFIFLFGIIIIVAISSLIFNCNIEGFSNFRYNTLGDYPNSQDGAILPNSMLPSTGRKNVSSCEAQNIWKNYPIFEVGSYEQKTNNIRYPDNPDEGTCTPADFCRALYKNRPYKSNVVKPLPPAPEPSIDGARVNYYKSSDELMPFYNEGNILY